MHKLIIKPIIGLWKSKVTEQMECLAIINASFDIKEVEHLFT